MQIPLASFVDFVLKSGSLKKTCAEKIKAQLSGAFDPAKDYYKRFREAVYELHSKYSDKEELSKIIGLVPDKKVDNYNAMITGYRKFLCTKKISWFDPLRKEWKYGGLEIPINSELGLEWNRTNYVIKLYLKTDRPSKDRVASILALMKYTISAKDCVHTLLDVRNSKPYFFEDSMLELIPLVEAEATSLEHLLK
ncbi:hypothetical protein SAMN05428949_2500 [Chitinophaga sp. YR627]|uniref:hypothetical protein n=1 Tax=Chitinophaga sp. YR627 TaxID=1881041 RepID=UPI0008E1F603|nr:hypothetical protein [Chitinophaga sp. YR627]SFN34358.1 hypothetical protein SAMN05428949_2500 [Chitinophaga sp. YR627]